LRSIAERGHRVAKKPPENRENVNFFKHLKRKNPTPEVLAGWCFEHLNAESLTRYF
jgi:hypothetical protein